MKILYKLIAGFLMVAVLTGFIAYIGLTNTNSIESSYMDVQEETFPVMDSLEKMKFYTEELLHHYTNFELLKSEGQGSQEELNNASEEYYNLLNKYEALVIKYFHEERGSLEKIKSATERFNRSGHDLLELEKSGAPINGSKELVEINAAEEDLIDAIDEALEKETKEFYERSEKIGLTIKSTRDSILLVSMITFILSIVIGAVISFSISRPIIRLKDAADEIRRGKLDTVVDIKSNDETGVLADAFNKMVRDLSHEIEEHKLTAINLNEGNDFVKTVLESLPHPFYVIDAKDYTIKLANSAACAKGSAAGTTCYALTHKTGKPCGTEGHQCPLEEVKRTCKPAVAEHLHYDKDGNVRNMEVHCYPIFDSEGNVAQAIEYSLDITERKWVEEELRLHGAIISSMEEGVNLVSSRDGKIIYTNPKFNKMFGYSPGELIGKHISIVNAPTDNNPEKIAQEILDYLNEKGNWSGEINNITKDGKTFWCYANVSKFEHPEHGTVWISVHQDITDRKQAEETIRDSEAKYHTLFESSSDAVMMLDEKGFFECNNATLRMFGYSQKEDFLKMHPSDVSPPYQPDGADSLKAANNKIAEAFGKGFNLFEWTHRRKNGEDFPAEVLLTAFQFRGKQVLQATVRDITERKRAQEALAESEERYRTIIEHSNDMVWSLDINGNFTFINKQAEKITGYHISDFIGKTFLPLINKDDIPGIMELFQKTLSGKVQHYEITIKRSDGSDLTLSVNSTPYISKGEISGAVSFARDITQSRLAEIALRESEERFRSVAQSANDAIISTDGGGNILFWNNAALKIFGYNSSEVMGKPLTMLMPETYREAHKKGLERMHTTGVPHVIGKTVELLALRKNGSEFPMEISLSTWKTGDKTFYSGILRDITERKKTEEAIRESEERFRSVSLFATDAIISSDGSGKIIFWNNAAQKIFGYESSEVLGKPITILMHEKFREDHNKVMERIRTTGESHIIGKTVELQAIRKDGSEFPMEITLSTWKTGEKTFFSGILRDITERRRNEDIRRDNERLALANRAKSEFLTVMSHELRTPLNAIIGFSELIKTKDAGVLNEKQQRYADHVHSSGKHLLSIIDDILDLTRVESGKMEFAIGHVSVPDTVNDALENLKERAGKQNIIIKKDLIEIEFIDTDEQKFRQVLNNLLDNAVKFSKPEGGTVTITSEKEGNKAKFSVSDTGIGIKEEDMGRLFHGFEQLDAGIARKYGGTGLGLAVSKKLVELLGGTITAESKYGEGSTFTFYLPMAFKKEGR